MSHDDHSLTLLDGVLEKLRRGETLDNETLHHLASCEQCSDALEQLRRLDELLVNESVVEARPGIAARVIGAMSSEKATRALRLIIASIATLVLSLVGLAWMVYATNSRVAPRNITITLSYLFLLSLAPGYGSALIRRAPLVPGRATVALFLLAFALTPLSMRLASSAHERGLDAFPWMLAMVAFSGAVCGFVARGGGLPFKRIRPGRILSGVALGLSSELGVSVGWIRFALIVLLVVARLPAIVLYALLDISMRVHPEDRPNLFRFRLRRWLRPAA